MNRLDLVAGRNGAGKSTFVELTLAPLLPGSVFVNADEIAKQRWPEDPATHAYEAALIAAETRAKLIELGRVFIAETVFLIRPARPHPRGTGGRLRRRPA
jgi:predicted ABC-type ATPase